MTDFQLLSLKLENLILKEEEILKREIKIRKTQLKDLGKPKRPWPSFLIFCHDLRQRTSKKLSLTEMAANWNALNDDERKIYADKANENSERYRWKPR